jgi:hypothetical protein
MTKLSEARKNLTGGLRPHERLGAAVAQGDVGRNGFESARGGMRSAFDLCFAEQGEPALDQIQLRSAGKREIHQIRFTVLRLRPNTFAIERVLQWVASSGRVS